MGTFDKKPEQQMDNAKGSKSTKDSVSHKAGDMLERAGEKLKDIGADKAGNAVYRAGNKLEHSQDKKKSGH